MYSQSSLFTIQNARKMFKILIWKKIQDMSHYKFPVCRDRMKIFMLLYTSLENIVNFVLLINYEMPSAYNLTIYSNSENNFQLLILMNWS